MTTPRTTCAPAWASTTYPRRGSARRTRRSRGWWTASRTSPRSSRRSTSSSARRACWRTRWRLWTRESSRRCSTPWSRRSNSSAARCCGCSSLMGSGSGWTSRSSRATLCASWRTATLPAWRRRRATAAWIFPTSPPTSCSSSTPWSPSTCSCPCRWASRPLSRPAGCGRCRRPSRWCWWARAGWARAPSSTSWSRTSLTSSASPCPTPPARRAPTKRPASTTTSSPGMSSLPFGRATTSLR
mmetsp:Transcript_52843/g.167786  ORF Transcript_52843/g.167786 Transcript_52843/m.167786 type:complete len:242 (+) Transcript_52843:942-1667(+)